MKKVFLSAVTMVVFCSLSISSAYAIQAFHAEAKNSVPTELIHWDKEKAYNGYTIFYPRMAPKNMAMIYLIDMEGQVVHSWPGNNNPKLMENGNILSSFTEIDWDGKNVWSKKDTSLNMHHDTWRIWNPKLEAYTNISLTRDPEYTQENILNMGGDPSVDYSEAYADGAVEVDMDGNVIWKWSFMDHVVQDRNPDWANYVGKGKSISDYPGKLDLFYFTDQNHSSKDGREGVTEDWQHTNSIHYNQELDQIVINCRAWSEYYVIDHGATFVPGNPEKSIELAKSDAGDFLFRFGNPAAYQQGDTPAKGNEGHQQIYGAHAAEWIQDGYQGAGNLFVYDNGVYNPIDSVSKIVEINPYLDASGKDTGSYVNPPDAGYQGLEKGETWNKSNQVVWSFEEYNGKTFYSKNVSNAQRLANGNTLICAGANAHIFEVTYDGEVVWEYINPLGKAGYSSELDTSYNGDNSVFRAYRFGTDYPAFDGKELKPQGTLGDMFAGVAAEGDSVQKSPDSWKSEDAASSTESKGGKGGGKGGSKGGGKKEETSDDGVDIYDDEYDRSHDAFLPY